MKMSFTGKIRLIIILLLVISLIQGMIILQRLMNFTDLLGLKLDIQNTILISIFFQFVLTLILIFYIPSFLHRACNEVNDLLRDITRGVYSVEIDLENYRHRVDPEFLKIIENIREMLKSIRTFDRLKKEKIVEHHNRIIALLNLTVNGFIIIDNNGNIVYINEKVTENFKAINEKTNLIETNFPPDVENNIKKYAVNLLKTKSKQDPQQFFFPALKKHVGLNSAIIRGLEGEIRGAIISISNLEKKKAEKGEEAENPKDE
ncbi:MAG: hypothetical protein JW784_06145 [Candidatus Cloacimonetes bacterium]|nr:hypothetical protein [Candidatus Cloacimonadota bacterium]